MTPDRCEHWRTRTVIDPSVSELPLCWECSKCGLRFIPEPPHSGAAEAILARHANSITIPSDVLEEARDSIVALVDVARVDISPAEREQAALVLARIDAVLGKKP